MKPAQEVAEELCRWFTPDNEPIELTDVAHTREVIARCYADALRHAAEGCRVVSGLHSNPAYKNAAMLCAETLEFVDWCSHAIDQAVADKAKEIADWEEARGQAINALAEAQQRIAELERALAQRKTDYATILKAAAEVNANSDAAHKRIEAMAALLDRVRHSQDCIDVANLPTDDHGLYSVDCPACVWARMKNQSPSSTD